jgi:hypothetical protein
LQHAWATVGIIALIDEATGYQDFRARDALAKIIERFVAKEIQPCVRTFPPEFYKQIFRLYGWDYYENCGRPGVLGHITTNLVYKRLAPQVLDELRKKIPLDENGRLKKKLFQALTPDFGHPKLRIAIDRHHDVGKVRARPGNVHAPHGLGVSSIRENEASAVS